MKINVKVKPKSKEQKLEKNAQGIWIAKLKSPPVEGKANKELIALIAQQFQVKKSQVIIKSGLTSTNKIIEIMESEGLLKE